MNIDDYRLPAELFYQPVANEIPIFEAAWQQRLPVMLKGPTGCGKTRFIEHMAWRLNRPLITVAAHEDMTAADLAGRYLLADGQTEWHDGPLTRAVRGGAICYLDEIVEARQDTTVLIHPLTDARRMLPLERRNELVPAHPDFLLVISYNPGYQSAVKDLKESTKQRFVAIDFAYPEPSLETESSRAKPACPRSGGHSGARRPLSRNLRGQGIDEGASTRMLIHAARLAASGISVAEAARAAIVLPMTDDMELREALTEMVAACIA